MTLIEYVGPPGSGKTYQARLILSSNKSYLPGRRSLLPFSHHTTYSVLASLLRPALWLNLLRNNSSINLSLSILLKGKYPDILSRIQAFLKCFVISFVRDLLISSNSMWIADQSSAQFLLDEFTHSRLSISDSQHILHNLIIDNPRVTVVPVCVPRQTLLNQILKSDKHMRQSLKHSSPNIYSSKYQRAFLELYPDFI